MFAFVSYNHALTHFAFDCFCGELSILHLSSYMLQKRINKLIKLKYMN